MYGVGSLNVRCGEPVTLWLVFPPSLLTLDRAKIEHSWSRPVLSTMCGGVRGGGTTFSYWVTSLGDVCFVH